MSLASSEEAEKNKAYLISWRELFVSTARHNNTLTAEGRRLPANTGIVVGKQHHTTQGEEHRKKELRFLMTSQPYQLSKLNQQVHCGNIWLKRINWVLLQ